MPKPKIDAKQALDDIRAGMSDSDMMTKYNLSARGLESLLTKLVSAGAVRSSEVKDRLPGISGAADLSEDSKAEHRSGGAVVSAREAVMDIRSGIDDAALMNKYHLSAEGLHHLFHQLVSNGLIDQSELDARESGTDSTVDVRGLGLRLGAPKPAAAPETSVPTEQEETGDRATQEEAVTTEKTTPVGPQIKEPEAEPVIGTTLKISSGGSDEPVWVCPACERPQPRAYEECPICGVIVSKFKKKTT